MKNQSMNTANGEANFIDLKTAKNPIYQPMAGKTSLNTGNKLIVKEESKKVETSSPEENKNPNVPTETPKSLGGIVHTEKLSQENSAPVEGKVNKPALNLEGTLKLVMELHRRMVQRGRLVYTIDNLDKFEIEQKEEAEDINSNCYQGCALEITDDRRNKFSTKNPVIIRAVTLFIRQLCIGRLAEIEAEITIPA